MRIEPTQSSTLRAQRKAQRGLKNSFEKLSSGKKLNRAADNPAALAIYKQLEAQEVALGQASRNTGMGMDFARAMDGALGQQSTILNRMRELSIQAGNGSLNADQRDMISQEFNNLRSDLDRIASTTELNGQSLLQGGTMDLQVGTRSGADSQVSLTMPDSTSTNLGLDATNVSTSANAWAAIDSIDKAIQNLNTQRANVGSTHNRLEYAESNIQQTLENHSAARARIGDTDFAEESTNLSRQRFMMQAALKIQQIENSQKGSVLNLIA